MFFSCGQNVTNNSPSAKGLWRNYRDKYHLASTYEKKNAPPVAAEGAESNIRASTLDGFILLAVAKKSIPFVQIRLFL